MNDLTATMRRHMEGASQSYCLRARTRPSSNSSASRSNSCANSVRADGSVPTITDAIMATPHAHLTVSKFCAAIIAYAKLATFTVCCTSCLSDITRCSEWSYVLCGAQDFQLGGQVGNAVL